MTGRVGDSGEVACRPAVAGPGLRRREERVAEWAAALLGVLQQAHSTPAQLRLDPPESRGWRHNDGGLTPAASELRCGQNSCEPEMVGTGEAGDGEPGQVRIEVSVGRLGTIALVVERGAEGLRLLLSATQQATTQLLESECSSLQRALAHGGLPVESIKFQTMAGDGPSVASGRTAVSRRFARAASSQSESGSSAPRKSRRLNAVG